jgi:hypothetical protein
VLFGTATSTFTVNSDTQITVVSPAGSGTVHVTVITPKGTSATSSADQFTYQGAAPIPPIPTVANILPASGPVAGGTTVTITGTDFTGATKVQFGATAASFTVNTDKQITAVSPAHTAGWVDVTVTTPGGTSKISNADRFTYLSPPVADAGADQTVKATSTVTLDGSRSKDPGGQPLTYKWTQTAGPSVTLSSSTAVKPTFTAPDVETPTSLTFQLVVNNGTTNSSPDTVTITVQ